LADLSRDAAEPREAACLAVRIALSDVPFALTGWVCGSADQPATDVQVACLIDRLTVVGHEDPALKALFARSERHRIEGCRPAARVASARKS
jgi:hypothetical protein